MIVKCNKSNEKTINDYLKDCYYKSLYLYLNYDKYKFSNPDINTFIQLSNDIITCLLLSFGKTLHIVSKENDVNIPEICNFIKKNNYSVICTDKLIANSIFNEYDKNTFELSIGNILELKEINKNINIDNSIVVTKATDSDFFDIVDLLMDDSDKKKVYSRDSLYNQIRQINIDKYGRNYIIKDNDVVIAHAGTGAENSKIAVINAVIVDKNYRKKGLATTIVKKLCEDLLLENKICYLMVLDKNVERLYEKIGFCKKSTYGKLVRR